MNPQMFVQDRECGNMPKSTSYLREGEAPHKPTDTRRESFLSDVFDDYRPSEIINNDSEQEYTTEDDLQLPDPAPSGRSSISSFPASVLHHEVRPSQTFSQFAPRTPSRSRAGTPISYQPKGNQISPTSTRDHMSGFRNPSSVRALQMRDEFSDHEDITPGHRRRDSRISYVSYRSGSAYSTPGKRASRSLQTSPVKNASKLRKEFPLVLLHCSILPSIINPKAKAVNEELLEAIIPEPYKKRWKLLQEKVSRNAELCERGALISHPREDFDALQEQLLETIELERPVINNGHFIGRSESRASTADSGFGSEGNSTRGDAPEKEDEQPRCADCGDHFCGDRRWDVKVFAANGLMKAGAWSAAWPEMEKVDVQVSVWLPEDVRLEIEARLDAVIAQEQQLEDAAQMVGEERNDERSKEIYGDIGSQRKQEDIDGLPDFVSHNRPRLGDRKSSQDNRHFDLRGAGAPQELNLERALSNYFSLLLQDKRNIAIIVLCVLLFGYGMSSSISRLSNTPMPGSAAADTVEMKIEYRTSTVVSTSTFVAVETSTVVQTENAIASSIARFIDDTEADQPESTPQVQSWTVLPDTTYPPQNDDLQVEPDMAKDSDDYTDMAEEALWQVLHTESEIDLVDSDSTTSSAQNTVDSGIEERSIDEL